ncbi:BamA/TamA family outer membrane protein [Flammeovirga aprica]|uniref:BamA/TamA family outer membrane protein n=1 Tax=Flammeovirga aprica JL-4 TaxID=694437 RepID=A0A7X9RVT9_9BACT|nr:BamA/TamA family outer membrane protein [Flammeovirga aprica]NME69634.1 BamA/TamA family outer membrane protein [Flammeovirga aprica JL-4]
MKKFLYLFSFYFLFFIKGYAQDHTVFLIGDAGLATKSDKVLQSFFEQIHRSDQENSTVIFLGDNVYPHGLENVGEKKRTQGEEILKAQLEPLKSFKGDVFMVPGNHDYNRGKKNGLKRLRNEEKFVNSILGDSTLAPFDGCPDPVEIPLNDEVTLLLIDTQWLIFDYIETAEYNGCEYRSVDEALIALQDIVSRNKDKKLIIAGHHPVITYGEHGGVFTAKDHLFPLTSFASWAYLPLPVIGSIYPIARKSGVNRQDTGNKVNRKMTSSFENIFKNHPNIIYASGHEHTLQYNLKDNVHYIVSGSGSKTSHVKQGKYSKFAQSTKGFSKVTFTKDGSTNIEYFDEKTTLFSSSFLPKEVETVAQVKQVEFADSVIVPTSTQYATSTSQQKWMGENYRKEWETPIKMPVFDLSKFKGGVKIVQRGGGMATLSFRLQDSLKNQYTLRSIDKNPIKAIPEELKQTIATAVVQDQISAAHPYSPLTVPIMADAIGIYHANPQVVYVGDDPQFGIYQEIAANKVYMLEERPSKNTGDVESFGNAKKIYSTIKTVKKLREDNDNYTDYEFTLKSRLFDMLIGDWDRHDDQWRWAAFKQKKGRRMFRPIPRDRDQVFFLNEGIIPNIASSKYILPKFEGFDDEMNWAPGFNFNARYFDRYFLAQADLEDWIAQAEYIQKHITDEVILEALQHLPEEIRDFHHDEIFEVLKARRTQLPDIAKEYYAHLAKHVSVLGSDKMEQVTVERLENGFTEVTLKKISKKGNIQQTLYHRVFDPKQTKEIRIYGFGGKDTFIFKGNHKSKIKVRVIGGDGEDTIEDTTDRHSSKNILIYDTKDSTNIVHKGGAVKKKLSKKADINDYNRAEFKFNSILPILYGGYIPDDGILLGGGFVFTNHSFRKVPFASKHTLYGAIATANVGAFKLKYKGQFTDVLGNSDLVIDAVLRSPKNSNYYGMGNESVFDKERGVDFYRFLYTYHDINTHFLVEFNKSVNIKLGGTFIHTDVSNNKYLADRYFAESGDYLTFEGALDPQNYFGPEIGFEIDKRNNSLLPKKGVHLQIGGRALRNFENDKLNYINIDGQFTYHYTFKLPTDLTLAYHVGGATNFGDYHYLMANKIGGNKNMRGFRRDRFYGDASLYNSLDAHLDIFKFKNSIIPFTFGVIGFYDFGRVWLEGESSDKWHESYGGGIYIAPVDKIALSSIVGASDERLNVYFNVGFSF